MRSTLALLFALLVTSAPVDARGGAQPPCDLATTLAQARESYRARHYAEAVTRYRRALEACPAPSDPGIRQRAYYKLGNAYRHEKRYAQALEAYREALGGGTEGPEPDLAARIHNNIASVDRRLGRYAEAIEHHRRALTIRRRAGDRLGQAKSLVNLGGIYQLQGRYFSALQAYRKARALFEALPDGGAAYLGTLLNNMGLARTELGQYDQAIAAYRSALALHKDQGREARRARTLHNLAYAHRKSGQPRKAVAIYQQARALRERIGDRSGLAVTLNNLGYTLDGIGEHRRALPILRTALDLSRALGERGTEARTLDSIGAVHDHLGEDEEALFHYRKALLLKEAIGDRAGERETLAHIAVLFARQERVALAVLYYKRAVNITEAIRGDLKGLSGETRRAYVGTVAGSYRRLADLLLAQDRVLEAQRVLDLLKVEEVQGYLRDVRGNDDTARGVPLLASERAILTRDEDLGLRAARIGEEYAALRAIPEAERSPAQTERLHALRTMRDDLVRQFSRFVRSAEVRQLLRQLSPTQRDATPSLKRLRNLSDNLARLGKGAVLLYPLVLEDRLELVLATGHAPPIHRAVAVSRRDLNRTILDFRMALLGRRPEVRELGQRLYGWLVGPIERVLADAGTSLILYAPDAQLRYVPLAALYDGERWLAERFAIDHITADSLTDLNTEPAERTRVLAAAFTKGTYRFTVGATPFTLSGLRFAGQELENVARYVPDTAELLDTAFDPRAVRDRMDDYTILHLATHAALVPGDPEESFILFGNGDRVTLRDIETDWIFTNTDLVVLSACETGLGGRLGDGQEILGFGYLMEQAGARATIASLWSVSDGGTQVLMTAFYHALGRAEQSKAEALQAAQVEMIRGSYGEIEADIRGIVPLDEVTTESGDRQVEPALGHPYYWAAFILIGNGL